MNRPQVIVPLILLLLGFAGGWVWTHFERVSLREWVGYSGEACSDRLYAARRLVERMGARARSLEAFDQVARLPARATLIVTANAGELARAQIASVLEWVRGGGHLLIEAQSAADQDHRDPARTKCDRGGCGCQHHNLLAEFAIVTSEADARAAAGVSDDEQASDDEEMDGAAPSEEDDAANAGDEEGAAEATPQQPVTPPRPQQQALIDFPGRPATRVHFGSVATLRELKPKSTWRVEGDGGLLALRFPEGSGWVTVVSSLRPADNWNIDKNDHADFFWQLAALPDSATPAWTVAQPRTEIVFVRHIEMPNLWTWLQRNAAPALILLGVLLLLLLWRVVVRFGPIEPAPVRGVRSLYQHLAASGRFLYRHGKQARLMSALREECMQQLFRAAPEARQMESAARLLIAAQLSGLAVRLLTEAFSATPRNAHEFLATTRTLAQLRASLLGRRKISD